MTDRSIAASTQENAEGAQVRTLDGMVAADRVVYVVGTNQSGYLPDATPYVFADPCDALQGLADLAEELLDALADAEFDMFESDAAESTCGDLAWIKSMRADGDDLHALQRDGCIDLRIGCTFAVLDYVGHVVFVHARSLDVLDLDESDLRDLACDGVAYGDR